MTFRLLILKSLLSDNRKHFQHKLSNKNKSINSSVEERRLEKFAISLSSYTKNIQLSPKSGQLYPLRFFR